MSAGSRYPTFSPTRILPAGIGEERVNALFDDKTDRQDAEELLEVLLDPLGSIAIGSFESLLIYPPDYVRPKTDGYVRSPVLERCCSWHNLAIVTAHDLGWLHKHVKH